MNPDHEDRDFFCALISAQFMSISLLLCCKKVIFSYATQQAFTSPFSHLEI